MVDNNLAAVEAGRAWVRENYKGESGVRIEYTRSEPRVFISGNDAFAFGALSAGCRFMAGYPITPATEILEWMARQLPRFGGVCIQAEDEISAICMTVGASFSGVKSMTATSGPGLSLKQEGIGLAVIAELPIVIADTQRGGPSTGLPTRTEQSDLNAAIYGGHGDCPKVVLAATNIDELLRVGAHGFRDRRALPDAGDRAARPVPGPFAADHRRYPVPPVTTRRWTASGSRPCSIRSCGTPRPMARSRRLSAARPMNRCGAIPSRTNLVKRYARYALTDDGVSPITEPGIPGGEYMAVGHRARRQRAPRAARTSFTRRKARSATASSMSSPSITSCSTRLASRPRSWAF